MSRLPLAVPKEFVSPDSGCLSFLDDVPVVFMIVGMEELNDISLVIAPKETKRRGREAKVSMPTRPAWASPVAVDSVNWICRKGNDNEEPLYCHCYWNSWFTKAELGYKGAGIEVGIDGFRFADEAQIEPRLKAEPGHPPEKSWSGAARKEWMRQPEFLFAHDNPKGGGYEEML